MLAEHHSGERLAHDPDDHHGNEEQRDGENAQRSPRPGIAIADDPFHDRSCRHHPQNGERRCPDQAQEDEGSLEIC